VPDEYGKDICAIRPTEGDHDGDEENANQLLIGESSPEGQGN